MTILAHQHSKDSFEKYVKDYNFGTIPPTKIVIHHTAVPTKDQWKGRETLAGIRKHYESKGWPSGPHLFIAEDGIWTFTPMSEVGTHARAGNGSWIARSRPSWYSIGIEVVGNYDTGVWEGKTKDNVMSALKVLMDTLGLKNEDLTFHRDWNPTHCPGLAIKKDWLLKELEVFGMHGQPEPSPWAKDGWEWARELGLDLSIHPQQEVHAEWIFAILKKLNDIRYAENSSNKSL